MARERDGETETKVASGEFTFVALDNRDKPRPIAAEEEKNG
jgi:acyl-CoA thioesterase YciA